MVDGQPGLIRIKRATTTANQVQVWRGEPLAVHVPDVDGPGVWYVIPVAWQLKYAREHAIDAKQHGSHAYDCMQVRTPDLSPEHLVDPTNLAEACQAAIRASRSRELLFVVRAIHRTREAVAQALIETLEEVWTS